MTTAHAAPPVTSAKVSGRLRLHACASVARAAPTGAVTAIAAVPPRATRGHDGDDARAPRHERWRRRRGSGDRTAAERLSVRDDAGQANLLEAHGSVLLGLARPDPVDPRLRLIGGLEHDDRRAL